MSLRNDSIRAYEPSTSLDVRRDFTDAVERAVWAVAAEASIPFSAPSFEAPRLAGDTFYFATIGFVGAARGTLMVVATKAVIEAMSAAEVRELMVDDAFTEDVVGELANLTLGRLKNVLLPRGVEIVLAVPATGSGTNLRFTSPGISRSMWLVFASAAGALHFRVDADLSNCPPFGDDPTTSAMTEGELVLF